MLWAGSAVRQYHKVGKSEPRGLPALQGLVRGCIVTESDGPNADLKTTCQLHPTSTSSRMFRASPEKHCVFVINSAGRCPTCPKLTRVCTNSACSCMFAISRRFDFSRRVRNEPKFAKNLPVRRNITKNNTLCAICDTELRTLKFRVRSWPAPCPVSSTFPDMSEIDRIFRCPDVTGQGGLGFFRPPFPEFEKQEQDSLPPNPEVRRRMNNELDFPPNFERLVLGCIDADFCM